MAKVLVLGNAGLDISLQMPRLPQRGETLLGDGVTRAPGGKGLNQAVAAARAGARTLFAAPIGSDSMAGEIIASLSAEQTLDFQPQHMGGVTDFSLLMVLPDGENSIVSAGPCATALSVEPAAGFGSKAMPGDLFLAQGNLSQEATLAAFKAARSRNARTVLNPAPIWWDVAPLLAHCDILIVNRGEAEVISGLSDPAKAAEKLGESGAQTVIVTLGAEGCLVRVNGVSRRYQAVTIDALDTTGCGDTFCGTLCASLSMGLPLQDAISHAQSAAAITATRTGAFAALPTAVELSAMREAEA